jgi:hypothetical protein
MKMGVLYIKVFLKKAKFRGLAYIIMRMVAIMKVNGKMD